MSTFNGIIREFPDIRVDFFRNHEDRDRPLAGFLSHVHSDHLAGIENWEWGPFIYTSFATRELLLRLEKHESRIKYALGILEKQKKTYKKLDKVLKALPLDTPVSIELKPGNSIQVTLFDANHCPGSVMFLFEGPSGHAVLYTGDVRSEPWFVNALVRNPSLIHYSNGLIKTLDKIYLDTSFVEDIPFQTKAEGIQELLRKVSLYPEDTIFHVNAWTFGYEDVWFALAKALGSRIHVDNYKLTLFKESLKIKDSTKKYGLQLHTAAEAPRLVGFSCANNEHDGILTDDTTVRLHSCEKGNLCPNIKENMENVVWIQPMIAHLENGVDMAEVGIGGGGDEMDTDSTESLVSIAQFLEEAETIPDEIKKGFQTMVEDALLSGRNLSLGPNLFSRAREGSQDIKEIIESLGRSLMDRGQQKAKGLPAELLPRQITFPYSRHSSYPELCDLVSRFKPRDVWPCTVVPSYWKQNGITIGRLFGAFCANPNHSFEHDGEAARRARVTKEILDRVESAKSQQAGRPKPNFTKEARFASFAIGMTIDPITYGAALGVTTDPAPIVGVEVTTGPTASTTAAKADGGEQAESSRGAKRSFEEFSGRRGAGAGGEDEADGEFSQESQASTLSERSMEIRMNSWEAILSNAQTSHWTPIGLLSTTDNHTAPEKDLGHR